MIRGYFLRFQKFLYQIDTDSGPFMIYSDLIKLYGLSLFHEKFFPVTVPLSYVLSWTFLRVTDFFNVTLVVLFIGLKY